MPLQLETFAPERAAHVTKPQATLESLRKLEQDAYERGVRDGAEASAREHMQSQTMIRTQFVEALLDERMTQQAIEISVTRDLLDAFETVIRAVLPELAAHALDETLKVLLEEALTSAPDPKPVLSCAPELVPGVEFALTDWAGDFELRADAKLTPLEARLAWDNGYNHVDFDRLSSEIVAQIQSFRSQTETLSEDMQDAG